jgi:hypothetical protein
MQRQQFYCRPKRGRRWRPGSDGIQSSLSFMLPFIQVEVQTLDQEFACTFNNAGKAEGAIRLIALCPGTMFISS